GAEFDHLAVADGAGCAAVGLPVGGVFFLDDVGVLLAPEVDEPVGGPIGPVPVLGAWVGGAVDDGEVGVDGVDAAELRPDVVLVVSVASAGGEDAPGLLLPCPGAAAVVGGASVFEWR